MAIKHARRGTRVMFKTPFSTVGAYAAESVNGRRGVIVRAFRKPDADHDAESLPMFAVKLDDGRRIQAWPEELTRVRQG